jgi:hypothetical protein
MIVITSLSDILNFRLHSFIEVFLTILAFLHRNHVNWQNGIEIRKYPSCNYFVVSAYVLRYELKQF